MPKSRAMKQELLKNLKKSINHEKMEMPKMNGHSLLNKHIGTKKAKSK